MYLFIYLQQWFLVTDVYVDFYILYITHPLSHLTQKQSQETKQWTAYEWFWVCVCLRSLLFLFALKWGEKSLSAALTKDLNGAFSAGRNLPGQLCSRWNVQQPFFFTFSFMNIWFKTFQKTGSIKYCFSLDIVISRQVRNNSKPVSVLFI